jgi:MFS family permease
MKKTTELSLSRLIYIIGLACITSVWSLYMKNLNFSDSIIGFLSSAFIAIAFLGSIASIYLLEKFRELKLLILSLLLLVIFYLSIFLLNNKYIFILLAALVYFFDPIQRNSFDILFKDRSSPKKLSEDEGFLYSLMNIGWFIGPLLCGFILLSYEMRNVFVVGTIFLVISILIILLMTIRQSRKKVLVDFNYFKNFKNFFEDKRRVFPLIISSNLQIWWTMIFVFMPLYIVSEGLGNEYVGYFISLIMVPLIILDYKIGKLSEKYGSRKFFIFGFLFLSLLSITAFFVSNVIIVLILFIIAGFAISLIEPLQETFFFKHITLDEEDNFFPVYTSSKYFGSFFGRMFIALLLLVFPIKIMFLVVGLFMFLTFLMCLKIAK